MADKPKLPPGATIVSYNGADVSLPPGASMATDTPPNTVTGKIGPAPEFPSKAWFKSKFYTGADKGTNLLPAAGGIAGGIIGGSAGIESGPGAIATAAGGAALGGAAGEAARQHARRALGFEDAPMSSLDAAKQIGTEGLKQGAYELGGQVVGRIGRAVAPKVAEAAVFPGKRLLKSMPDNAQPIGQTILKESKGYKPATISKELSESIGSDEESMRGLTSAADQRYTIRPKGLLPAAPTPIPLGRAPTPGKMPGALIDAEPFPRSNIGGGPPTAKNVEELGSTASTIPGSVQTPDHFMSGAGPLTPGMEPPAIAGPGILLSRDATFQPKVSGPYVPKLAPGAPSLSPARGVVDSAISAAEYRNSPKVREALFDLKDQLATDVASGQWMHGTHINGTPIPANVLPSRIRAIKQGIGERVSSWSPDVQNLPSLQAAKERAYGALDGEFHRAVPGSDVLDTAMMNKIPARDAAYNQAFDPGIAKQMFEKLRRPTGALVGSTVGATEGYKEGGIGGMVVGGTLGLAGGNLIASPEGMMIAARGLGRGAIPVSRGLRYAVPIGEGLVKPSSLNVRDKKKEDETEE